MRSVVAVVAVALFIPGPIHGQRQGAAVRAGPVYDFALSGDAWEQFESGAGLRLQVAFKPGRRSEIAAVVEWTAHEFFRGEANADLWKFLLEPTYMVGAIGIVRPRVGLRGGVVRAGYDLSRVLPTLQLVPDTRITGQDMGLIFGPTLGLEALAAGRFQVDVRAGYFTADVDAPIVGPHAQGGRERLASLSITFGFLW